jgi:hypothetical protein
MERRGRLVEDLVGRADLVTPAAIKAGVPFGLVGLRISAPFDVEPTEVVRTTVRLPVDPPAVRFG